jgi:phosphoribosylformylglycinamidine synthase
VFAIGARPVAILDSLRFGEVAWSARSRYLLEHAVAGIGHYGNSIGVATVGGEIYFEAPYEQNCLVNAMCVGLIETGKLVRSAAAGVGNVVVLLGAPHRPRRDRRSVGARLRRARRRGRRQAPQRADRRSVRGEPAARVLARAARPSLLVALQDLGAAGLTSSSAEMASKGSVGIDLDVRRVPLREADMEPFEIMVSESQERMLCVVEPDRLDDVLAVCARWEVNATAIGEVTAGDRLRVFDGETLVGDLPVTALVDECPAYDLEPLEAATPVYPPPARVLGGRLDAGEHAARAARQREPRLAAVGVRAVRLRRRLAHRAPPRAGRRRGAHARARRRDRVSIDGNGRRVGGRPVPRRGRGRARVLGQPRVRRRRAARAHELPELRQPEKPHIAWQLTRAVAGLGDACRALGVPVVGGNVSLYNEGGGGPIYPTPVVGMVGELPDAARAGRLGFAARATRWR